MKRVLSEPLVHFLVLGAGLFGAYAAMNPAPDVESDEIVVTAGHIDHLAVMFARMWQRPPTPQELEVLIDDYVQEEILSREAIKLGLDQNDTIIRRRLRQKMEFIAEDLAVGGEPTDAELEAYFRQYAEAFREEPRVTFRHVFLREDRGHQIEADAANLLARLNAHGADADVSTIGDRLLVPAAFDGEPLSSVVSYLGAPFAERLGDVDTGAWSGPIRSAYGLHLVLLTERTESYVPPLEQVRDRVKHAFLLDRREELNRAFLDALLARYEVIIESTGEDGASGT